MDVLVVNVGSSTVKLQVVDDDDVRIHSTQLPAPVDPDALDEEMAGLGAVGAVGHRIVHGGPDHVEAELVTDGLLARLDEVARLAPLHDPPALEVVRLVRTLHPELPAVACFDTAFHSTLPEAARRYAVPQSWVEATASVATGSTGLSHRYASHRAAEMLGRRVDELRVVDVPPGCRGLARCGRRRTMCRHHHGIHAAGGTGDGHPIR